MAEKKDHGLNTKNVFKNRCTLMAYASIKECLDTKNVFRDIRGCFGGRELWICAAQEKKKQRDGFRGCNE